MIGTVIGGRASAGANAADRAAADRRALFEGLSALLIYPRGDVRGTTAGLLASARDGGGGKARGEDGARPGEASVAELISAFAAAAARLSDEEMEELYTRTFDLNPAASLETGWQLYGEAYERGAFLVKMREMLRRYRVPEGGELPDHLAPVLLAMGRMPVDEAAGLASSYVGKAVAKMIAAFPGDGNPYLNILKAVSLVADGAAARKESAHP